MITEKDLLKNKESVIELAKNLLAVDVPDIEVALQRNPSSIKKLIGIPFIDYGRIEAIFRERVAFNRSSSSGLPAKFTWYLKALAEGVGPFSLVCDFLLTSEDNLTKRDWKINNFVDIYGEMKGGWMNRYPEIHNFFEHVDFYFPATEFWYLDINNSVTEKLAGLDYLINEGDEVIGTAEESLVDVGERDDDLLGDDGEPEVEKQQDVLTAAQQAKVKMVRNPLVDELARKATRHDLRPVFVVSLGCYVLDMVYSNIFTMAKSVFDYKVSRVAGQQQYTFGENRDPSFDGLSDNTMLAKLTSFYGELEALRGHILSDAEKIRISTSDGCLYTRGANPVFFSSVSGKIKIPKPEFFGKLIIQDSEAAKAVTMSNFKARLVERPDVESALAKEIDRLTKKYVRLVTAGSIETTPAY